MKKVMPFTKYVLFEYILLGLMYLLVAVCMVLSLLPVPHIVYIISTVSNIILLFACFALLLVCGMINKEPGDEMSRMELEHARSVTMRWMTIILFSAAIVLEFLLLSGKFDNLKFSISAYDLISSAIALCFFLYGLCRFVIGILFERQESDD